VRHVAGWNFEHSAYVLLIDKHGEQRVGIPFEELDATSLANDIRALRSER
jgi:cytochrome oxidase Cu insertion factor (SCO1/SenC/PrrC family)